MKKNSLKKISELSWPYIAGFFDGDGCIYFHPSLEYPNGRIQLHMVQCGNIGKSGLIKIERFLKSQGLFPYVHEQKLDPKGFSKKRKFVLRIERQIDVLKFLNATSSFLIFRKLKAEKGLSQLEKYLVINRVKKD